MQHHTDRIVNHLERLPLLAGVSPRGLRSLAHFGSYRDLEADALLFREGEQGDTLYVILSGELRIYPEAEPKNILLRGEGEVLGEIALLDGLPRTATVAAQSQCELFELTRDRFESFLSEEPILALNVMRQINQKVRTALEKERALNQELERLNMTLESIVARKTSQLRRAVEDLQELADRDALTGVFNRRKFDILLRQALETSNPVGLIMLDVDHFKQLNDTHGHQAGDRVLMQIADVAGSCLTQEGEWLARYGGEEFAVILNRANKAQAASLAEQIRSAIERFRFNVRGSQPGDICASLGVAVFPDDADDPQSLIEAADRGLYRAKEEGRNRVVLAPGMTSFH